MATATSTTQTIQYIEPKKKYRNGYTLFFSFFRKNLILVSISIFFNIISSLFATLPAVFIGVAIDELLVNGMTYNFWLWSLAIIVISLSNLVTTFLTAYSFSIAAFAFERDIRQEFFDTIQSHSLTFHDEQNSSKLLSMGMTETQQIRQGVMFGIRMVIQTIFTLIIVVLFLNQIKSIYAQIALVGFLLYVLFAFLYSRRIIPVRTELANYIGELTEANQEIFRGIEVVRGFSADTIEKEKFTKKSILYADKNEREGKLSAFYYPGLILLLLTAAVFSLGIMDVNNQILTTGQMIQALGLLFSLQRLNFMLPQSLLSLQAGIVNSKRMHKVMNWQDPQPDTARSSIDINWNSTIKFENVSFSYTNNDKKALENINLEIPSGSQVALIGGPGSGKTTFLKLLLRLYDPQEGKITIDEQDFSQVPAFHIRQHVAQVEQEIFLFSASIKDNISFANPNATDEEIESAAKAAQASEFIEKMPKKYETVIGERGFTLSGGQRQRLAIARAILANPNILLLDDSASAIDARTEYLLRTALENLMTSRTSITVTQRLNTLVRADIIILLDKGQVSAIGTHEELLKTSKKYRLIFELLPESERVVSGGAF